MNEIRSLLVIFAIALIAACGKTVEEEAEEPMATNKINEVMTANTDSLMAIPGVVGVYVGELEDGTPCIGVLVKKMTPDLQRIIPQKLEGYPVKIEVSGEIRPMNSTS
jgi:hypothetical protein